MIMQLSYNDYEIKSVSVHNWLNESIKDKLIG